MSLSPAPAEKIHLACVEEENWGAKTLLTGMNSCWVHLSHGARHPLVNKHHRCRDNRLFFTTGTPGIFGAEKYLALWELVVKCVRVQCLCNIKLKCRKCELSSPLWNPEAEWGNNGPWKAVAWWKNKVKDTNVLSFRNHIWGWSWFCWQVIFYIPLKKKKSSWDDNQITSNILHSLRQVRWGLLKPWFLFLATLKRSLIRTRLQGTRQTKSYMKK